MKIRLTNLCAGLIGIILGISLTITGMAIAQREGTVTEAVPLKNIQRFTTAISEIKNYYIKPVADDVLFDNAIRGMLAGLDPHSSYLDENEYKELTSTTQGEFSGLGLELTTEDGVVKVVTPIDDSPAQKAGIKPGDLIVSVDNTPVKGMTLVEVVKKMRGQKGSTAALLVVRKGEPKLLKINVKRDVVTLKSIKAQLVDGKYGYVRLSNFQAPTAQDLTNAINKMKQQAGGQLKGLVLDMRNNPGGLLDSAVGVSNQFLHNNNVIVYAKGRTQNTNFVARATNNDILNGAPMVILINGGTASAAEIVAGALQDEKRAIVMGQTSFGKGSVQTVLPLDNNTAIKLTTALYYTPKGRSIQAEGIVPDITVANLDISKATNQTDTLDAIKEANLPGHILNSHPTPASPIPATSSDKGSTANNFGNLAKDYQFQEAMNVLKGLVAAKDTGNQAVAAQH